MLTADWESKYAFHVLLYNACTWSTYVPDKACENRENGAGQYSIFVEGGRVAN